MVTESEPEFRRRRLAIVDRGEVRLIILAEHFLVLHEATVEIDLPTFRERPKRDAGIVLHNHAAVVEQKIPDTGEAFGVHEVGGGLEQAKARALVRAPFQKRAGAAREVGLEIVEGLLVAIACEVDLHSFRRAFQISRVEDSAIQPRQENVKDREGSAEVCALP